MNIYSKILGLGLVASLGLNLNGAVYEVPAGVLSTIAGDASPFTWETGNEYVLQGVVYVNGGNTLTIQKGVIIRGQPEEYIGPTRQLNPGTLVITRDGWIDAQGTSTQPIIFTTAATDNDANDAWDEIGGGITAARRWVSGDTFHDNDPLNAPLPLKSGGKTNYELCGGLIVLGNAPNNVDGISGLLLGERYIEGLPENANSVYGGVDPNDNSGVLKYISVRHTGGFISSTNDINGLTLGSVGYGTKIEYIEAYCTRDDAIEFFGGTVNTRYLAAIYFNDDGFDMDEGFSGLCQFWFALATTDAGIGDNGFEWDGDHEFDNAPEQAKVNSLRLPRTYPYIMNATFIGGGSTGKNPRAIHTRHNASGAIMNSILTNCKGPAIRIGEDPGDSSDGDEVPNRTLANYNAGLLRFHRNVWWNFKFTGGAFTNTQVGLADSTDEQPVFGADPLNLNAIVDPLLLSVVAPVNPRPAAAGNVAVTGAATRAAYTSTFFTPVTYKGAFSTSTSTRLWTTNWTAAHKVGALVQ
ncbi:MAG: hypothetical protein SFY80_02090 [Verrucomicrobiota bacterium]|nr:hypothetical protein [Verrucomicrobiota bacterium]